MLEIYAPKYQTSGTYTGKAYGYVPGNQVQWELKTFSNDNPDINKEVHFDDVLTADFSLKNFMHDKNGNRIAFSYIPFYIKNTESVEVFDLGYKLYENPSSVQANLTQNFAASARQDANNSDTARNINSFELLNTGIFFRGVLDTGSISNVSNLSNTIWTNSASPGNLTSEASRVILNSDSFIEAENWFKASPLKTRTHTEGSFSISSYVVPSWGQGSRASYINNLSVSTSNINQSIRIPAGGIVFGYYYIFISDAGSAESDILSDSSIYKITRHGKWSIDDLIDSDAEDKIYMHTISKPWDVSETIDGRLFRYGAHFVARKVNT